MISFLEWSNAGSHRISSLKCGHFFGLSCIEKWLNSTGYVIYSPLFICIIVILTSGFLVGMTVRHAMKNQQKKSWYLVRENSNLTNHDIIPFCTGYDRQIAPSLSGCGSQVDAETSSLLFCFFELPLNSDAATSTLRPLESRWAPYTSLVTHRSDWIRRGGEIKQL